MKKSQRIEFFEQNPYYWQYKETPLLLLGGSKKDNLFQIPDLREHLEEMVAVGGNYIRNTMSDRNEGDVKVFVKLENGKFDLEQWNPEYWKRFEEMLELTQELGVIVQIELWDQWDHQNGRDDCWEDNPWNPDCNINYSIAETSLKGKDAYRKVDSKQGEKHDLFLTVPELNNDSAVLHYQQLFINKILSYTLNYGNVLYTITNELFLQHPIEWSNYWANYLHYQAAAAGVTIHVTEMCQVPDLAHAQHQPVLDQSELYTFFDMSQNAGQRHETHWEKIQWVRERVADRPRPLNNVKMYGADGCWLDSTTQDAIERFWRNILGGAASVRFHRPPAGLGLGKTAQTCLKAARLLTCKINMWEVTPDMAALIDNRANYAYCASTPGKSYVVYLTDGGSITLDLTDYPGSYSLEWINSNLGCSEATQEVTGGGPVKLVAPDSGHWVATLISES